MDGRLRAARVARRRRGTGRGVLRAVAALAAVALIATACSSGDDDGTDGSGAGGGDGAGGDALRYGLELNINFTDTFDPARSLAACDRIILEWIYGTLTTLGSDDQVAPGLAESWELQDDGATVVLHLVDGVTFSDGTPFDAEAVKTGLEYLKTGEQTASNLRVIDSIDVVDARTVRLNLSEPSGLSLLFNLASREGMIPAPASIEAGTAHEQPVGAGPYTLDSFQPGARILLTQRDDYTGPTQMQLPAIAFTQVGVGVPAVNALRAGEVDLISFEAESYGVFDDQDRFAIDIRDSNQYLQLQFRLDEPFDKVEVRQAVNHAIDRETFNQVALAGKGEVAWMPYRKGAIGYNPDAAERYPYDPQRARELLAEAGYPDGFTFDMVIPGGGIVLQERQAEILQQQLGDVGIGVNISRSIDIAPEYYIQKKGDAFSAARLPGDEPTAQIFDQWGQFQFVAVHNYAEREDITKLVKQARATTDLDEIDRLLQEASAIIVDEALEAPLAFQPRNIAWDTQRVGGTLRAPRSACEPIDIRGATLGSA